MRLHRFGEPVEIADLVLYLASQSSNFICGQVIVIDGTNHHVFQPLLYQVATSVLNASQIGTPIRGLLGRHKNTTVIQGAVTAENIAAAVREVAARRGELTAALAELRDQLGEPGAAARAAHLALEVMG